MIGDTVRANPNSSTLETLLEAARTAPKTDAEIFARRLAAGKELP